MADTLLDVVKRVARRVGLDPAITAFSDDDETQLIVDYINDAESLLRDAVSEINYLDKNATLSTVASQRLYSLASDATALELYEWSIYNDTNNVTLEKTDLETIVKNYPDDYTSKEGKPLYIYVEAGQVGLYPIPDAVYDINYIYKKELVRKSSTTATFDYPDDYLRYLEYKATAEYMTLKKLGEPALYFKMAQDKLTNIATKEAMNRKQFIL